jgi:KipI family sensor histidine kinase inhibitor
VPSTDSAEYPVTISGDDLLSIEVGSPAEAQSLADALRQGGVWREVVAGIGSVAVQFDAAAVSLDSARQLIENALAKGISPLELSDVLLQIPVVYGGESGPDLDDVCDQTGLTAEEVIALHTGKEYRVDLVGFTPGFAYVGGLDDKLNVARRDSPRQRVEAGSVGIADGRTGLYALPGPGGWPLIGRTAFRLFDPSADDPFPIRAGMRVRFVSISASAEEA